MKTSPKSILFPESNAAGFAVIDCTIVFFTRIRALMAPEHVVLDLGAGRGQWLIEDPIPFRKRLITLRGSCKEVIGCDVDPVVMDNPGIDRAILMGPDGKIDLSDNSVDLILCDWVLEHIEDPTAFAAEISRVLKPGGWFCARTPNRWGYISVAARLIPERLHQFILSKVQPNRKSKDVFPAHYKLNTISDLKRSFKPDEWEHCSHAWESTPAYFGNSVLAWRMAMTFTKFMPRALGSVLLIYMKKRI